MTPAPELAHPCPSCGQPASGKFCAACGAPLGAHTCGTCGTHLAAGAKFCHHCGSPFGRSAPAVDPTRPVTSGDGGPRPSRELAPWFVAGVMAVITIAAVAYSMGRRSEPGAAAPASAAAGAAGAAAPDISQMTPKEQFNRLIDRVTLATENADTATVARFWPMAVGAYQNLPPGDRDNDARFHMGWLHLFAAQYPQAAALADTIMASAPTHLFGYYLRASIAQAKGDSVGARAARKAFRTHFDAEMARPEMAEYGQHRAMLERFRDTAPKP